MSDQYRANYNQSPPDKRLAKYHITQNDFSARLKLLGITPPRASNGTMYLTSDQIRRLETLEAQIKARSKKGVIKFLDWFAYLIILLLLPYMLYLGKSDLGIDLVKNCHAYQVLLDECPPTKSHQELF